MNSIVDEQIRCGEYEKSILVLMKRASDILEHKTLDTIGDESIYTIIKEWHRMYKEYMALSDKYRELLDIEKIHASINGRMQQEITTLKAKLAEYENINGEDSE